MKTGSPSRSFKFLNSNHYCGPHNRPMRVADILVSSSSSDEEVEEEIEFEDQFIMADGRKGGEGGCRSFQCTGAILSRWLSLLKRRGVVKGRKGEVMVMERVRRERKGKRREEEGGELGVGSSQTRCSMNGFNGDSASRLIVEECRCDCEVCGESGRYRKETSFNLGVGFGLIYLTAMGKNELNKMMELRKQTEMLLQNVKDELHREDTLYNPPTYVEKSTNCNGHLELENYTPSYNLPYSESTMKPNQLEAECVEGIDQLEAELEAELERLQLRLDTDYLPIHLQEERIQVAVEETAPEGSLSASFGEVVDPFEEDGRGECGVPPHELKIRLHELLDETNEERIKELEAALEHAKQKLQEKEIEVLWWKDTARLISKRALKS